MTAVWWVCPAQVSSGQKGPQQFQVSQPPRLPQRKPGLSNLLFPLLPSYPFLSQHILTKPHIDHETAVVHLGLPHLASSFVTPPSPFSTKWWPVSPCLQVFSCLVLDVCVLGLMGGHSELGVSETADTKASLPWAVPGGAALFIHFKGCAT